MRQLTHHIQVQTRGRRIYDITAEVTTWARQAGITTGMLTLYIQHTSASLLINARLVPDGDPLFVHVDEGTDDMPAHVRTALTQTHLCIPVLDGKPALGTWQGIFLYEHRRAPYQRRVLLHLIGE